MSIVLNARNAARIDALLAEAQAGQRRRLLDRDDLLWAAGELDRRLALLPVALRVGAAATVFTGDAVPNSYRHTAMGSYAELERRATGWAVVRVWRDSIPSHSGGGTVDPIKTIVLSRAQTAALNERTLRDTGITVAAGSDGDALESLVAVVDANLDAGEVESLAALAALTPAGFAAWFLEDPVANAPIAVEALRQVEPSARNALLQVG